MSKCSCYHTKEVRNYTYHPITGAPIPHDQTVGVCYGTKEMDECSCGGDESKCDFYPEKRKGIISTVEVIEVRYGKWVSVSNKSGVNIGMKCSLCGARIKYSEFFNGNHHYCHKCGARMDGERKEQG